MRLYLASPCRAIPDAVCSVLFPAEYLRQELVNVSIACPCPRPILPIITTTITTSAINTRNITITTITRPPNPTDPRRPGVACPHHAPAP
ncbi:hypothetical protein CMUS01_04743 [Colletotrichum musicola]|uniref:Uncharacterized protein n=1 Tax=Colletotrichum musicola TaxID=2175873 RepID=A0A8H6NLL5_9PEZI|nr:hypothetical protein CMUS01_04743 [Colletotrichum musicola]